jgi:hypothetical protein
MPVPARTTEAYIGTAFNDKPPFFMTIAMCDQKILVIAKNLPTPIEGASKEITLPGRDLQYIKGNVLDSEYMPNPTNRANFADATINVLTWTLGGKVSPLETLFLAQDRYGLVRPCRQSILSLTKLQSRSQGKAPHIFQPTEEEIHKNRLSDEQIKELAKTRKNTHWIDFIPFFNGLTKTTVKGNPLTQKEGLHPFAVQLALNGKSQTLLITAGTVVALQCYAEKHLKNEPSIDPFRHISKSQIKEAAFRPTPE